MKKRTTNGRVWLVLCVVVMLLGVAAVGTLISSAEQTVVAKIGDVEYTTLQSAIDAAASGETTIVLVSDCAENVTVKQSAGKNIIIDGNGKTFTGTLYVDGNKRSTGAETLLVKNLNFVLSGSYGIAAHTSKNTFPHNVTVDGCTFTDTSDAYTYGIYIRHAYNITVKNTEANGLFDFVYANTSVTGFTAENVQITDCSNGFVFAYGSGIELSNVTTTDTLASVSHFNRTPGATMKLTECDLDSSITFGTSGATGSLTIELDHTVATLDVVDNVNKLTVKVDDETSNLKVLTEDVVVNDADGAGMKVVCDEGIALEPNADGSYGMVISHPVAKIGDVEYTDLQAAIDAAVDGDVITLIADINLDGSTAKNGGSFGYDNLYLVAGKKITIDFGGHYINVTPETRGEANAVAPSYENIIISVIFVNDSAGLTLTGNGGIKTFDAAKMMYCLVYNNNATVNVESGEYVGNVSDSMFYGDGDHVTNINGGNFEVLNLKDYDPSGSLNKPWVINTSGKNETYVNFTGGTFNYNININYTIPGCNYDKEINISDGYKLVDNGDGTWSVEFDGFIKIGDVKYDTLAEAIAAVKNGETIDLLGDCAETVVIKQTSGLSFTIDGNGNNYTGTIVINGNNGYSRSESLTIKNINFVTENTTHTFINANSYNGSKLSNSHNVTVDNCTFTGPEGNNSVQSICVRTANKLTISNCTATNVMYLVQSTSGGLDLQVINCVVDASYGVRVHNGNKALIKDSTFTTLSYAIIFDAYTSARSATLENVTINAENGNSAIYLNNKTTVGTLTLNLNGENEFIGNWLQIAGTGATVKVASANVADLDLDKAVYGSDYRVYVGAELCVFTERAVTFTGAQLNLGNSFGIYYNADSSTIFAGIDYVAIVTNADGKVVAEIPSSEWVNGNKILYSGLAAKQMSDEFTVEVQYNGEVVSLAPVTTSIKSYVARGIENNVFDEETLALLTAMLNYGAVAQDSFNYNEDDLANTVVAGQPVVNVPVENNTVAGADYYGASLNLESNIIFNFKFRQDKLDGVEVAGAIVSYVNNNGETVKVELEVGTETTTKFPKDLYVVKFSTFIPADAAQLFTCELVDSEGNVVASAQDGILSYCARAIEGLSAMHPADYNGRQFKIEFYQAIANYIVACSNYAN